VREVVDHSRAKEVDAVTSALATDAS
jgi:hypothetical protein